MNIFYPVFVLVFLTLAVLMRLAALRFSAVKRGEVDPGYFVAYLGDEPLKSRVTARHLTNLLETPVLFYVACLVAFASGQTGSTIIALAWAYVVVRVIHSLIHLGPNTVIWRFRAFALSILVLFILWLALLTGMLMR